MWPLSVSEDVRYCADPKCEGSEGFYVTVVPDSRWEPGYIENDYCPYCGSNEIRERPPMGEEELREIDG